MGLKYTGEAHTDLNGTLFKAISRTISRSTRPSGIRGERREIERNRDQI